MTGRVGLRVLYLFLQMLRRFLDILYVEAYVTLPMRFREVVRCGDFACILCVVSIHGDVVAAFYHCRRLPPCTPVQYPFD